VFVVGSAPELVAAATLGGPSCDCGRGTRRGSALKRFGNPAGRLGHLSGGDGIAADREPGHWRGNPHRGHDRGISITNRCGDAPQFLDIFPVVGREAVGTV